MGTRDPMSFPHESYRGKMFCPECKRKLRRPHGAAPRQKIYICPNKVCNAGILKIFIYKKKIKGEIKNCAQAISEILNRASS